MRLSGLIIILFVLSNTVAGQNIDVTGQIFDKKTNEPLSFVNLILVDKKMGSSTDELGNYKFTIDEGLLDEKIAISYVGYNKVIVKVRELINAELKLQPKTEELNSVQLYALQNKHRVRLNPFRRKEIIGIGNFSGGSYPSTVARYYKKPDEFKKGCFIKKVEISFFATVEQIYKPAKFRIRILGVNEDGMPGEDLLNTDIIVQKSASDFREVLDLLSYKINVPNDGFYIAAEHLFIEENAYEETANYRINDTLVYDNVTLTRYAPIFKGVLEDRKGAEDCYYKSIKGWKQMGNLDISNKALNNKIPSPAFIVTLTE